MARALAILAAITAMIILGQHAGIGRNLIENYPSLALDNINSIINCVILLWMAQGVASPTISMVWTVLFPIDRPTFWEDFVVEWLSCGLGTFACVLQFSTLPFADTTLVAAWVIAASAPIYLINYAISLKRNARSELETIDKRELLVPMYREFWASGASAFTFLAVHILPFSLIVLLVGAELSAAELLLESTRSIPFALLCSIALPPFLVPAGLWIHRLVRFKRSTAYRQYVWAYATPVCMLLCSALVARVISGLRVDVALMLAALALAGSWLAAIVYVRIKYDFTSSEADIDSTFA